MTKLEGCERRKCNGCNKCKRVEERKAEEEEGEEDHPQSIRVKENANEAAE